jgi:hypothetical protein
MDNESLGYTSSADAFQPETDKPSIDASDEKALVGLMRMVDSEIKLFHTISGIKLWPKRFSADTRIEMSAEYVKLLRSFKQKVTNAIDNIKEKGK